MLGWNKIVLQELINWSLLSVKNQLLLEPWYYWFWHKNNVQNKFGSDTKTELLRDIQYCMS